MINQSLRMLQNRLAMVKKKWQEFMKPFNRDDDWDNPYLIW